MADQPRRSIARLGSGIAWIAFCVAAVAGALTADAIPFVGERGLFAAGGRTALRIMALGLPFAVSLATWGLLLLRGDVPWRPSRVVPVLGVMAVLATASTVFALDRRVAVFGHDSTEQGLLVWMCYLGLVFLGSQLVTSTRRLLQLASAIVCAAALVAGFALLEVAGLRPFPELGEPWMYTRGMSTMMNPDFLGTFLVLPFVLGIGAFGISRGTSRWLVLGATALVGIALLYSQTRGAWLGAIAGAGALMALTLIERRGGVATARSAERGGGAAAEPPSGRAPMIAALVVVAAVVVAAAALPSSEDLIRRISSLGGALTEAGGLSGRAAIWREVGAAVLDRPVLGAGPGNLLYAWQEHASLATLRTTGSQVVVNDAHNLYLDIAVEFGLVFLAALIALVVMTARHVVLAAFVNEGSKQADRRLVVACVSAVIGIAVAFLTGITIVPILAATFAIIGGLAGVGVRYPSQSTVPRALGGVAIALAVPVAVWALLSGTSAVVGNQMAENYAVRAQRDLAALRTAPWRIYPALDLISSVGNLSESEQQRIGVNAEQAHQRLLALDGRNAVNLFNAGDFELLARKRPERALFYADRALALRPTFVPAIMLRGDALNALGRTDEAISHVREAVVLERQAPFAWKWDAPWVSYLGILTSPTASRAPDDPEAVLEEFERRFPGHPRLEEYRRALSSAPAP